MSFLKRLITPRLELPELVTADFSAVTSKIVFAIRTKIPFFAGRMGWYESYAINQHDLEGGASPEIFKKLRTNAGIFPESHGAFMHFHESYIQALVNVDVLGLMRTQAEAAVINRYCREVTFCELPCLEPYFHNPPWSSALLGCKVLVIHPFAQSISSQYEKHREKLFADPSVLPEFELDLLVPPQTTGSLNGGYDSWKSALRFLCDAVSNREFDVAIIGCGAYGFPLGAHVKSLGKVAVHLGGATQLLFGISGNRWRNNPAFTHLINEWWNPPLEEEKPSGWEKIENGCYW